MSRIDASGQFQLGADTFSWSVKFYAGDSSSASAHARGISVRVCLADAQMRELVIEFDPLDYPAKRPPSSERLAARIRENTEKAIEAGWRPESRGKPFRFTAEGLSGRK